VDQVRSCFSTARFWSSVHRRCLHLLPHLIRKWREWSGTAKFRFSSRCISLQAVCEQSASVFGSPKKVYQFVMEVHRIVTAATLQDGSQTATNA